MSKTKGANGEREVAKLIQPIVDKVYAEKGLPSPAIQRNLTQTRGGGFDLDGLDWLAIEVKRCEQLQVNKWWEQALRQAGKSRVPILIYRQNRMRWSVYMRVRLKVGDGLGYLTRGEVSLEAFLSWLEKRLRHELGKG